MNKNWTIAGIALVVVVAIVVAYMMMSNKPAPAPAPEVPTGPATLTVDISSSGYNPSALTIKVGDTVTWTNTDSAKHMVTSSGTPSGLNSPTLTTGQSYAKTFDKAGVYAYHCDIHPAKKGTITVE